MPEGTDGLRPGPIGPPIGTGQPNAYPGLGRGPVVDDDPAFQPPRDLSQDTGATRARAMLISREIPNVVIQSGWAVQDVRNALNDLTVGLFDGPAQLQDTIAGDSRIQSAMRSRSGGLLGRVIRFQEPKKSKDPRLARKCRAAWENHWPQMAAEAALLDLLETAHSLGFSYQQLLWDTSGTRWKPYLLSFNARYSYYHWDYRVHVAITRDGQEPVIGGDGHWVLHAPYGSYRGWMRGALRATAQWWLARNYALRDFARYCEKHGFPIILAKTPFGADPNDISNFQGILTGLGQESIVQVPGSVDTTKFGEYGLSFVEPKDRSWQAFLELIRQCNEEITLALLGQNLTTEVKEGSLAAARVHADVRQAILEADARALARTIYTQIARPFAALNFGDPELAPRVQWDVRPPEDYKAKADTFHSFTLGLWQIRQAGFAIKNPAKFARRFGIYGVDLEPVPPVQIEAQLARATGQVSDPSSEGMGDKKPAAPVKPIKAPKLPKPDKTQKDTDARVTKMYRSIRAVTARAEGRTHNVGT